MSYREWNERVRRLIRDRKMTQRAAEVVINAAMYEIGCLEGEIRKKIQEKIDIEKGTKK